MPENQLWYDKHRPGSLDDYVWSDPRLRTLIEGWIEKKSIPSVLFAGGPGRGKTSLANLLIKSLGIEESDVLRLKGSKDNNVDTMRTRVQEFCELGGWSDLRIVFFDEADVLSKAAQDALRNIIDDFSNSVRFIFTCNHPHKIEQAVSESRLLRIDIDKLPEDDFLNRMVEVLVAEEIDFDSDEGLAAIEEAKNSCYPDLRRALNLLENSVRDGKLASLTPVKSASAAWETYFSELMVTRHNPVQEVTKIREVLIGLTPDEMEDVYRFLYHNGTHLFGQKQIQAIFVINQGQKAHRNALLPDMILLEVLVRLMMVVNNEQE
jgi:DNA polymerase III delta prime subunit